MSTPEIVALILGGLAIILSIVALALNVIANRMTREANEAWAQVERLHPGVEAYILSEIARLIHGRGEQPDSPRGILAAAAEDRTEKPT